MPPTLHSPLQRTFVPAKRQPGSSGAAAAGAQAPPPQLLRVCTYNLLADKYATSG